MGMCSRRLNEGAPVIILPGSHALRGNPSGTLRVLLLIQTDYHSDAAQDSGFMNKY